MKEFNLDQAIAGMKIVDQDGYIGEYKLTNIHKGIKTHLFQFSVNDDLDQAIISYKEGIGWFYGFGKRAKKCEEYIGMAPVKKQEWINIHYFLDSNSPAGQSYDTPYYKTFESEELAMKYVSENSIPNYMKSVLIREWEE